MAKKQVKLSLKPRRVFSDKLKKKIVTDMEQGKVNVVGVTREYDVSATSVYKWLKKFSSLLHPSTTLVVEMDSEQYKSKELANRIAELEAALGRKQMEIDYLNKLIDIAGEDLGLDLKKNISTIASTGINKTKGKKGSV
ncbi:MAG TPA: transposase [Flavisolibacter sp.]|jgi:transposase-like protein|nr:transposase [Flavisolibacter sp.]